MLLTRFLTFASGVMLFPSDCFDGFQFFCRHVTLDGVEPLVTGRALSFADYVIPNVAGVVDV
jgi:hypothetical protein